MKARFLLFIILLSGYIFSCSDKDILDDITTQTNNQNITALTLLSPYSNMSSFTHVKFEWKERSGSVSIYHKDGKKLIKLADAINAKDSVYTIENLEYNKEYLLKATLTENNKLIKQTDWVKIITNKPYITTKPVSNITYGSVETGGVIDKTVPHTVKNKGVCWNTDETVDLENCLGQTNEGEEFGDYLSKITGLTANTEYFTRAYSIGVNKSEELDTIYGEKQSFQTLSKVSDDLFIKGHYIETELPAYVNIMFQVTNSNGDGVDILETEDFELLENNEPVLPTNSERDMRIRKKDQVPYKLKTVLLLDHSRSVKDNLNDIKESAIALVDGIAKEQELAIYVFDSNIDKIQDFTGDKNKLKSAIKSIELGSSSTDLYGGIITGVKQWENSYSTTLIEQGFLVVLTDGDDEKQAHTLNDVLKATKNKKVYTVGLGNDIKPEVLEQIGNAGNYSVTDVNQLTPKFKEIQEKMLLFANSFYWLNYLSPITDVNKKNTLSLSIKDNPNTGDGSKVVGNFNSKNFFSPYGGLFVNVTKENPKGIDEIMIGENKTIDLKAYSFFGENLAEFEWLVNDNSKVKIIPDEADKSKITIEALGVFNNEATLTLNDKSNNLTKTIKVKIVREGTYINVSAANPYGINEFELVKESTIKLTASSFNTESSSNYKWTTSDPTKVEIINDNDNDASISIKALVHEEGEYKVTVKDEVNNWTKEIKIKILESGIFVDSSTEALYGSVFDIHFGSTFNLSATSLNSTKTKGYEWTVSEPDKLKITRLTSDGSEVTLESLVNEDSEWLEIIIEDIEMQWFTSLWVKIKKSGIYINATDENPEGLTDFSVIQDVPIELIASTHNPVNNPYYEWSIEDKESFEIINDYRENSKITIKTLKDEFNTTILKIKDINNNLEHKVIINSYPKSISEDFESMPLQLDWDSSSNWFVSTDMAYSGTKSFKSKKPDRNKTTTASFDYKIVTPSKISFYAKTSCQKYFDHCKFSINGEVKFNVSESNDWQLIEFDLPIGNHSFLFSYYRGTGYEEGGMWIDNIKITPTN